MKNTYEYSTVDQPEIVNDPRIFENESEDLRDGRGIPNYFSKNYQYICNKLFFALDKCYSIMNEPYKIIEDDDNIITFEHTRNKEKRSFSREEINIMCNESARNNYFSYTKFSLENMSDIFHKIEINYLGLHPEEVKKAWLNKYNDIFDNLTKGRYPRNPRTINSLFYMSIALDFDREKQKNLAKYFINNALNTCYREGERNVGCGKSYNTQEIRKKIGLSIQGIVGEESYEISLSGENCKAIAKRAGMTKKEFSDVLYDVCLFKLGDEKKASPLSKFRMDPFNIEEIKPYLLGSQKTDIEDIQYILKKDFGHSRRYSNNGGNSRERNLPGSSTKETHLIVESSPYELLKANQSLGISIHQQRENVEKKDYSGAQFNTRLESIEGLSKGLTTQYKFFKRNVDWAGYKEILYIGDEGDTLFITETGEGKNILGSIKVSAPKKDYYCEQKVSIMERNIEPQYWYGILKIFGKNNIELSLRWLRK